MKLVESSANSRATFEVDRDDLLILKNVLYEAYVEIGEWDFKTRMGADPKKALSLLKAINEAIKTKLKLC